LYVLDAGQFSTRCRCCGWRSGQSSALGDAQAAFQSHPCPVPAIGSAVPATTPGHRQVRSTAAPGWTDETKVPRCDGGEAEVRRDGRGRAAAARGAPLLGPGASTVLALLSGPAGGSRRV
jgi:hypothetical protein